MGMAEPVAWSVLRSLLVGLLCLRPTGWLADLVDRAQPSRRAVWLTLILAPLFVPDLLIGFSWRLTAARLADSPLAIELLYGGLLSARALVVGTVVRLLWPRSAVTGEALHLWQALRPRQHSPWRWWRGWVVLNLTGPWLPGLAAGSLMTVLTFQEFEIAALLQINRHPIVWTVHVFDAQAAWQPLADTLAMLPGPVVFELLLFLPVAAVTGLRRPSPDAAGSPADPGSPSWPRRLTSGCLLLAAFGLLLAVPVASNAGVLLRNAEFSDRSWQALRMSSGPIFASLGFASAAAVIALIAASGCLRRARRLAWLLPGLCGALVCSLCLLALFQIPGVRPLYDTWLPLITGLVITHLPRAALVVLVLQRLSDDRGIHAARLLQASPTADVRRHAARLHWVLTGRRWLVGLVVMTHWCFWDVTTVSILRPVDVEPIVTRLYNEMHYGRTEALVQITLLACLATPAAGLLLAVPGRLLAARLRRRV